MAPTTRTVGNNSGEGSIDDNTQRHIEETMAGLRQAMEQALTQSMERMMTQFLESQS